MTFDNTGRSKQTATGIPLEAHTVSFKFEKPKITIHGKTFDDAPSLDWLEDAVKEKLQREKGCPYCYWIDPARLEDDEVEGPRNFCRVCARDLRVPKTVQEAGQARGFASDDAALQGPHQNASKTHIKEHDLQEYVHGGQEASDGHSND